MDAEFEAAAAEVKTFTKRPTNDELLQLYGLYKQATVGDNNTGRMSLFLVGSFFFSFFFGAHRT
jgi:diazepam-binding inhibitor (GABA receptor modulating acyl-CoA-binding protein)